MAGKTSGKNVGAALARPLLLSLRDRAASGFHARIFRLMLPQALPRGDFCVKHSLDNLYLSL